MMFNTDVWNYLPNCNKKAASCRMQPIVWRFDTSSSRYCFSNKTEGVKNDSNSVNSQRFPILCNWHRLILESDWYIDLHGNHPSVRGGRVWKLPLCLYLHFRSSYRRKFWDCCRQS